MYLISSLFLLCVNENTETISKDQFHNVKNPLHDLYWLTDLEFYDCEGNVICEFGGFDGRNFCFDFECNVSDMELIYNDSNTVVHNDTTYCITNPLQELKWLREKFEIMKANPFKSYIYKCIYNYQEGFIIDICFMCPDVLVEFYDCEGNVICEFGGFDGRNTCPDFESNVSNMELIWTNDDTNTGTINMKDNPEIQCYLNHGSLVVKFPGTDNPQYNLSVITLDGIIIHSGNYNTWNLRLDNLGLKPKRLYLVSILDSKQKMVYKLFNN